MDLPSPLRGLSPQRLRFVAAITALVAVAAVVGITLVVRGGSGAVTPVAAGSPPGPVVLVPGYGGSRTGLDQLADALRTTGRDATVLTLPGDGTGDLVAQARTLSGLVEETLSRTGAGSVDLVGYSAGGVVVRLYVQEMGGASHVRRVVTLGSPHHGANLAASASVLDPGACAEACAQLEPGSSLLAGLNGRSLSPGPAYISLYTTQDMTVQPPTSAVLSGATNVALQTVCGDAVISHGDLPTSPLVVGIVRMELASGPVLTPGSADCATLRAGA